MKNIPEQYRCTIDDAVSLLTDHVMDGRLSSFTLEGIQADKHRNEYGHVIFRLTRVLWTQLFRSEHTWLIQYDNRQTLVSTLDKLVRVSLSVYECRKIHTKRMMERRRQKQKQKQKGT